MLKVYQQWLYIVMVSKDMSVNSQYSTSIHIPTPYDYILYSEFCGKVFLNLHYYNLFSILNTIT